MMWRNLYLFSAVFMLCILTQGVLVTDPGGRGGVARADVPTVDTWLDGLKPPDTTNLRQYVGRAMDAVKPIIDEIFANNWTHNDLTPHRMGEGELFAKAKRALETGDTAGYQAIVDKIVAWRKRISETLIPRAEKVLKRFGGVGSMANTVNDVSKPYEARRRALQDRLKDARTKVDTARKKHDWGTIAYRTDPDKMPADLGDAVREYNNIKAAIARLDYWVATLVSPYISYSRNFDRAKEALRILKKWVSELDKALSDLDAHKAKIDKKKIAAGKGLTPTGGGLTKLEEVRIKRIGELRPDVALKLVKRLPRLTKGIDRAIYTAKINERLSAELAVAKKRGDKKQVALITDARSRLFDLQILYHAEGLMSWWDIQLIRTKDRAETVQRGNKAAVKSGEKKKAAAPRPDTSTNPKDGESTSQRPGDGLNPNGTGLTERERYHIASIAKLRPDIASQLRRGLATRTTAYTRLQYLEIISRDLAAQSTLARRLSTRTKDGNTVQSERLNKVADILAALKTAYKADVRSLYSQPWWDEQKLRTQLAAQAAAKRRATQAAKKKSRAATKRARPRGDKKRGAERTKRTRAARPSRRKARTGRQKQRSGGIDPGDAVGSCFIAGTKVLMADGTLKNIEDVAVGDVVRGYRGSANKVLELDRVPLAGRKLYGFNGKAPFVTSEHPFLTADGWKVINPAGAANAGHGLTVATLVAGDAILTIDMKAAAGQSASAALPASYRPDTARETTVIRSIEAYKRDPQMIVYNLKLGGNDTYFADGYLVHNDK